MKLNKIIIPAIGCVALLASCNGRKSITDMGERANAIVKIVDATKEKLDTFGTNLSVSNLNTDITTSIYKSESKITEPHVKTKGRLDTTRTEINNGYFNITGKIANMVSDYKDSATITESKTKYMKGYAEASGSATGKVGILSAKYSGTESAEAVSYSSSTYDIDYAANLLRAYFNKSISNPDYDNFYFDLDDTKLNYSLDKMYEYCMSKSVTQDDDYANYAKEIDSFRNYQYVTHGLYRYGDLKEKYTLQDVTNTSRDIIEVLNKINVSQDKVVGVLSKIDNFMKNAELDSSCFTVFEKNGAYTFAVNLNTNDLNKCVTYINKLLEQASNGDEKIDFAYIPAVKEGSINASIQTDSNNLITNVSLNFIELAFEGKIDFGEFDIKTAEGSKIWGLISNIEAITINKLSASIKLDLDYTVTENAIDELLKPTKNNVWTPIIFSK